MDFRSELVTFGFKEGVTLLTQIHLHILVDSLKGHAPHSYVALSPPSVRSRQPCKCIPMSLSAAAPYKLPAVGSTIKLLPHMKALLA